MNKKELSSSTAATAAPTTASSSTTAIGAPTTTSFQTSSPVSVLDSSSSCSGDKAVPHSPEEASTCPEKNKRGRARSKRPRPTTFNPRPLIQLLPSPISSENSEKKEGMVIRSCETDSRLVIKIPRQVLSEPKKKKRMSVPGGSDGKENVQGSARKCMHCEVTKTPQWRAGPMGPKTLCNACGVRYKSGRLFPEYRPAASPTFVPCIHSNSHKKVLEMRSKTEENDSGELIPNMNNNLAMEM